MNRPPLESALFALLEQTADAAYAINASGEICSWNAAAERLFGYTAKKVVGRTIGEVTEARDMDSRLPAVTLGDYAEPIADFDREVRVASGKRIWVNVSTIVFRNERSKRPLIVHLARDIDHQHRNEELVNQMLESARQLLAFAHDPSQHATVESLTDKELRILKLFAEGRASATISKKLRISPQTLRNHLHHINRKLRTHSRLEAVTHAQRRGLID